MKFILFITTDKIKQTECGGGGVGVGGAFISQAQGFDVMYYNDILKNNLFFCLFVFVSEDSFLVSLYLSTLQTVMRYK